MFLPRARPSQLVPTLLWLAVMLLATRLQAADTATAAPASLSPAAGLSFASDEGGVRYAELVAPPAVPVGFTLLDPAATGITFTNRLDAEAEAGNHNLLNGSGVALGDYDGDGRCDLFLCSLSGISTLYRNLGDWRFQDVTQEVGLALTNQFARAAVFADVDGDGDLDLLISYSGKGVRLFRNDGRGQYTDSAAAPLRASTGSTSMALADIDDDGDLDLYVANYGENTIRSGMTVSTRLVRGEEQVVGRHRNRLRVIGGQLIEYGEPDVLYRNDGQGNFTPLSWTDGTFRDESGAPLPNPPWELGFTAVFHDINGDTHPDLYVCNDFQDPDRFWINDGQGRFRAIAREALRSVCHFSMTAAFTDLDRDGRDDLLVTDMISRHHHLRMTQLSPEAPRVEYTLEHAADRPQSRRNYLFWNRGDLTFADVAHFAGVANSDWSWTCVFLDADLDGFEDLFIGTGHFYDTQDLDAIERTRRMSPAQKRDGRAILESYPFLRTPNYAFRNQGDLTFAEVGRAWGFDSLRVSHSIALGDLDNDGDLDLVVNCLKDGALVYRNNASAPRVAVQLKGRPPNTQGIGARITLRGGAVPEQSSELSAGGRYLAGDAPLKVFAAGTNATDLTLEVRWRSGHRRVVTGVRAGRWYEIAEPSTATPAGAPPPPATGPALFQDVSDRVPHRHHPSLVDEFARQPLLPRRQGARGPAVAWTDLRDAGTDDLLVGASRGGTPALWRNDGQGQFAGSALEGSPLPGTLAGWASWPTAGGQGRLLGSVSSYTSGDLTQPPLIEVVGGTSGQPARGRGIALDGTSGLRFNAGPLALADLDGDGDLDLFMAGHSVPGGYPAAMPSRLFHARENRFALDATGSLALANVGLVNGALFADLDGDGQPELVLACEWGPLRVFRFDQGAPREITAALGLDRWPGLWQSVAAGDFDGDGRLDLVAGNWGLNSGYQITAPGPWSLYHGDFAGDGRHRVVEAWFDPVSGRVLPMRDLTVLEEDLPWLRARYATHGAFAQADVPALLGDHARLARQVSMNTLSSMLFLNRGEPFEPRPLPTEAQWAPACALAVGDFDGDGHEDVFLAQNFFAVRPNDSRLDAGRGLCLLGDGSGGFRPLSGAASGVVIYGEQRACAVADFDHDGRLDLCVTQHGEETRLFRNAGARPGVRLRLVGPPANPAAIGAQVRLRLGARWGPARELHAGNGHGSQDSLTLILAAPEAPSAVWVRWPGGGITTTDLPSDTRSVRVHADGTMTAAR
jgi:hypothetical protein